MISRVGDSRGASRAAIIGRMADSFQEDPRVYFAAERTLPPWVRTGLAMMGFGFVVARFGLFPAGN